MPMLRKYAYYLFSVVESVAGFNEPLLILRLLKGDSLPGIKTVRLRGKGLAFRVRGAMDVWSIKETFLDRMYERCGFAIQPGWTVIDIGAGLGDFTLFAAREAGVRVFAFEPFPESFALLSENVALNRAGNAQVFSEAVGGVGGTLVLDLAGGEPLQFQSRKAEITRPDSQMAVRARSLSDVFNKLKLESCDLLKLDCEGAEYDILMNAPPAVLSKIGRIVMEYHDRITAYTHHDLIRFLLEKGFRVEVFGNPVHGDLGYLRAAR